MANITIAGNSYVIASDISMADLETVKKYRPSALALTDEETKETLFKVGIGSSSVSDYGISFGGISNDEDKAATATLSKTELLKQIKLISSEMRRIPCTSKTDKVIKYIRYADDFIIGIKGIKLNVNKLNNGFRNLLALP